MRRACELEWIFGCESSAGRNGSRSQPAENAVPTPELDSSLTPPRVPSRHDAVARPKVMIGPRLPPGARRVHGCSSDDSSRVGGDDLGGRVSVNRDAKRGRVIQQAPRSPVARVSRRGVSGHVLTILQLPHDQHQRAARQAAAGHLSPADVQGAAASRMECVELQVKPSESETGYRPQVVELGRDDTCQTGRGRLVAFDRGF
jgi:hypothetical protein